MSKIQLKDVKVWTEEGFQVQSINLDSASSEELQFSGSQYYYLPPLVELFADFKEPGLEHVYSLEAGVQAMLKGGFGQVFLDPNSQPVCDQEEVVEWIHNRVNQLPVVINPMGALTKGQKGIELSEISSMIKSGAKGFSNGVRPLPSTAILRSIFEYSAQFDIRLFILPWENELCGTGLVHEDAKSSILGLSGWPGAAERITVHKCLELAKLTGAKVHLRQITLAACVKLIQDFQEEGVDCTFDVNPAHLFRSNENILDLDVNDKVIPPLRPEPIRSELYQAYLEGKIPVLSSQHRPVLPEFKNEAFGDAKPGNISLETTLSYLYQNSKNDAEFAQMIQSHSLNALSVVNQQEVSFSPLNEGVLFQSDCDWVVQGSDLAGRVTNSANYGKSLPGRVIGIFLNNSWNQPI